jgi:hypothetical protein
MPKRYEPIIRILCFALAAVVLYELAQAVRHLNPLRGITIPAPPALREEADNKAKETNGPAGATGAANRTNGAPPAKGTNVLADGSNGAPAKLVSDTNAITKAASPATNLTNEAMTNMVVAETTNRVPHESPGVVVSNTPGNSVSNLTVSAPSGGRGTNLPVERTAAGTNRSGARASGERAGNAVPPSGGAAARGGAGPGQAGGRGGPPLPPAIQASVDKIVDSELLGAVVRPQPMALMGIAGNAAFLRAPNGQTGMVKEGDELGGVKLVKIGINRVLVEEQGQKKELMIFSGFGGESLLPKPETSQ